MSVVGNLTVSEGNDVNLKCQNESAFPASNGSLFFFNGSTTYVQEVRRNRYWFVVSIDSWHVVILVFQTCQLSSVIVYVVFSRFS